MSNIYGEEREIQNIGSGGGGLWALIILIVAVAVLWFLSGGNHKGGNYDGYAPGPYAYNGGCGPCVQPTYKDESNWEQESHLEKGQWKIDRDVIEQGCKDREAIACDGCKTREYIAHLQERADDKAYNALAMSNMQKDNYIQTLQLMGGYNEKLGQLFGAMEKGFCKTDNKIDKLDCECLKRPPVWGEGVTPDTHHTDCDHRGDRDYGRGYDNYPRRGNCGGCNDGYGYGVA